MCFWINWKCQNQFLSLILIFRVNIHIRSRADLFVSTAAQRSNRWFSYVPGLERTSSQWLGSLLALVEDWALLEEHIAKWNNSVINNNNQCKCVILHGVLNILPLSDGTCSMRNSSTLLQFRVMFHTFFVWNWKKIIVFMINYLNLGIHSFELSDRVI